MDFAGAFIFCMIWVLPIVLGMVYGRRKNREGAAMLLTVFLGWLGFIILMCMKDAEDKEIAKMRKEVEKRELLKRLKELDK